MTNKRTGNDDVKINGKGNGGGNGNGKNNSKNGGSVRQFFSAV